MIPFSALLPYGIMLTCFSLAGAALGGTHFVRNEFKRDRFNVDAFDKALMARDYRLTGTARGQSDNPRAPEYFKINSQWKLENPSP